jgi:hypothetical protein
MNKPFHSFAGQPPIPAEVQLRTRDEPLDVRRSDYPRSSLWDEAWADCLVQACAATPWIIASAVGRLLFQHHA